jgi:hypothetical protein
VQHVVMVVPVDAEEYETQKVGQKLREELAQCVPALTAADLQLQDHDRDQDCDHAVAERFETPFGHAVLPLRRCQSVAASIIPR